MRVRMHVFSAAIVMMHCDNANTPCEADSDGVVGGSYTFDLVVDDVAFTPAILEAENLAAVTLTVTNAGTKPHDFVVDCLPTPNGNGCPMASCFPDASTVGPLAPGATVTTTFITPNPEGIYSFHSNVAGDMQAGQFVVQ